MAEIIYSKYSNERSRDFAIRTDILEDGDRRFVRKKALYPQGERHVKRLLHWQQELEKLYSEAGFACNRCTEEGEGILLEYLGENTLEEVLDAHMERGEEELASRKLYDYLTRIKQIYDKGPFTKTEEFIQVFGDAELPEGLTCAPVTNIDMVCGNLVLTETPTVLDYEWTFDFPVPCQFVLYRVIHYYVDTHSIRQSLEKEDFYGKFGITGEQKAAFEKMEEGFQKYLTGTHIPMRELFADMTPGVETVQTVHGGTLQVFFSFGEGYTEENSVVFPLEEGRADRRIPLPKGCEKLRVDPGERPCAVKIQQIAFDGKRASMEGIQIPQGCLTGGWAYIPKNDPNIADISVPKGAKECWVCLEVYPGEPEVLSHTVQELTRLHHQVEQQAGLIREMKNTKVWKWYQSYRNRLERKK